MNGTVVGDLWVRVDQQGDRFTGSIINWKRDTMRRFALTPSEGKVTFHLEFCRAQYGLTLWANGVLGFKPMRLTQQTRAMVLRTLRNHFELKVRT